MKENKKVVYRLPLESLESMMFDCVRQLGYSKTVLSECLAEERDDNLIALLCEYYCANNTVIVQLEEVLKNSEIKEINNQEQIDLPMENMVFLENSLLAKYFTGAKLREKNIFLANN
jgi:hypothetical protein